MATAELYYRDLHLSVAVGKDELSDGVTKLESNRSLYYESRM